MCLDHILWDILKLLYLKGYVSDLSWNFLELSESYFIGKRYVIEDSGTLCWPMKRVWFGARPQT